MQFVYPLFLAALGVLIIPLVIHLFHFRKYKTIRFSNVAFLRNIETERKNRNRLKHLLVLLMRCLAFASLVFAFAIPGCGPDNRNKGGKTAICIYIDNSWSMEQRNSDGIIFETAKKRARDIVNAYGEKAVYRIISNDLNSDPGFVTASEAIAEIDALVVTGAVLSAASVVKQIEELLSNTSEGNRQGYMFSDFQHNMFKESVERLAKSHYTINAVKFTAKNRGNLSIDSAWLSNPFAMAGEKNILYFNVSNYYEKTVEDLGIKLIIGNNTAGIAKATIPSGEANKLSIEFVMPKQGALAAELVLEDEINEFDNTLFLALQPQGKLNVKVTGNNSFLLSALQSNPFFAINSENAPEKNDAWYISDLGTLSEQTEKEFIAFVEAGGRGIINLGNTLIQKRLLQLPKAFGFPEFKKIANGKYRVDKSGLNHAYFKQIFTSIPANIELPTILEYQSSEGDMGNGEVVLSLDNGDPFLLKFKQGKGTVFLYTASFNPQSGNFVQSALFLPLVVNGAFNYENTGNIFGYASSGTAYVLKTDYLFNDGESVLIQGNNQFIPELQNSQNGLELFIGKHLNKAGFYDLKSKNSNETKELIALNNSRQESNPAEAETVELDQFAQATGIHWMAPAHTESILEAQNNSASIWYIFIWLAAFFLCAEILILRFWDTLLNKKIKTINLQPNL